MYRKFGVKIAFNRPKKGNETFDNNGYLKFKLCTPRRQHDITCSTNHYNCTLQTMKNFRQIFVINWIKVELRWTKFEVRVLIYHWWNYDHLNIFLHFSTTDEPPINGYSEQRNRSRHCQNILALKINCGYLEVANGQYFPVFELKIVFHAFQTLLERFHQKMIARTIRTDTESIWLEHHSKNRKLLKIFEMHSKPSSVQKCQKNIYPLVGTGARI